MTQDLGGVLWLALIVFGLVLFVLGVLMPWFVYRIASYTRTMRDEVTKMRAAVVGLRGDLRTGGEG